MQSLWQRNFQWVIYIVPVNNGPLKIIGMGQTIMVRCRHAAVIKRIIRAIYGSQHLKGRSADLHCNDAAFNHLDIYFPCVHLDCFAVMIVGQKTLTLPPSFFAARGVDFVSSRNSCGQTALIASGCNGALCSTGLWSRLRLASYNRGREGGRE